MRIISVAPAYPLRGGIADFNETLTSEFLKSGHDASIVSYSLQYPNFLFPGKTQFRTDSAPVKLDINTLLSSVNPLTWIKVAKFILSKEPDFVVMHFWMPFFAPALGTITRYLKKRKVKVVLLCHNIVPHEAKFYDRILTRFLVKKCDAFVTLAQSVYDELSFFTDNKNKIYAPHPIYNIFGDKLEKKDARLKLKLDIDARYILFFGMVRQYKGLDLLLESLAEQCLKDLNVKLIVAGEFYDKPGIYEEIIDRLDIKDRVSIFNEFISNEDVKLYFSACDLVTQTYHTATQSGISQIAYSFDKPMLVTNVGGLSEIVPHNKVGYVVEKNPVDIAHAISHFYNENKEAEFVQNVSYEKQKFFWDSFVEKILDLVKQV